MLDERKELPKVTIVSVRKTRTVTEGIPFFFSPILTPDCTIKDWDSWAKSFDIILNHPKFVSFCNKEVEVSNVYELIDELYKVEADLKLRLIS
jgi:hypothetical protein